MTRRKQLRSIYDGALRSARTPVRWDIRPDALENLRSELRPEDWSFDRNGRLRLFAAIVELAPISAERPFALLSLWSDDIPGMATEDLAWTYEAYEGRGPWAAAAATEMTRRGVNFKGRLPACPSSGLG